MSRAAGEGSGRNGGHAGEHSDAGCLPGGFGSKQTKLMIRKRGNSKGEISVADTEAIYPDILLILRYALLKTIRATCKNK